MINNVSNSRYMTNFMQIGNNLSKISSIALPLILTSCLPVIDAGIISYNACVATCPVMAAMAPAGLFAYTFESCMISCTWLLSPTCP